MEAESTLSRRTMSRYDTVTGLKEIVNERHACVVSRRSQLLDFAFTCDVKTWCMVAHSIGNKRWGKMPIVFFDHFGCCVAEVFRDHFEASRS